MTDSKLVNTYQVRGVNPYRLDAIRRFSGQSVLDVGCGNGAYVIRLQNEYDISGVDWVSYPSWQELPGRFKVADATGLEYPDDSFDTIVSFETLEHLPDPLSTLKTFRKICRKNVILTVPNCDVSSGLIGSNLIFSHWNDRTHIQFFNIQGICSLVESAGFSIETSYLINPLRLTPFLFEAFDVPKTLETITRKLIHWLQKRDYFITCLVVANKN